MKNVGQKNATDITNLGDITDASLGLVRKSLSANATTTATTSTNTNLSFSALANEVWLVEVVFSGQCSSTGGSKFQITAPTGAGIEGWLQTTTSTVTTLTNQRINAINTLSTTVAWTVATTPAPGSIWVRVKMSSTAGTVAFGIASGTSGQTTTIFAGSAIRAYRVTEV